MCVSATYEEEMRKQHNSLKYRDTTSATKDIFLSHFTDFWSRSGALYYFLLYNLCNAPLSLGVDLLVLNFRLQIAPSNEISFFPLVFSLLLPNILLSIRLFISRPKPLHRGLNQHHEWKRRPLGQRKGMSVQKRLKCTFPK